MSACKRPFAVLTAAAALATGSMAFAQAPTHSAMDPQNAPSAQSGNVGGRPVVQDAGKNAMGAQGSMEADMVVNGQIMKFAQSPETMGDQAFALQAAGGNMAEIELSKTIAMKTTDEKCKALAKTVMDEHQMAQDKLKPIAEKLGVKLPATLPTMHQAQVDTLKNMSPEMATKAYLSMMKADHLKAVSMYTDWGMAAKDADLKAYVTETLPHLRMHTAKVLAANEMMGMPLDTSFKDTGMNHGM